MRVLLEKATGKSAGESPNLVTCKWPLGRVVLYHDRIVLDARVEKHELLLTDIDHLQINVFQVNIEHQNPNIIEDISINGIFTARAIRKAIEQYQPPVKIVP